MVQRLVAALGLAFALTAGATTAQAADMYNDPEPRTGQYSPYDDPRYADVYRHPDQRLQPRPEDYAGPPPSFSPGPRVGGVPWQPCMSRPEIRRHARSQGWRVVQWHDITRTTATFEAERLDDGRLFDVSVDRCTAQLLAVNPVRPRYEDYAWRRRVYDRAY